ncbi:PAS domain-containing protein [Puniceicoccaceae bacterium K14]|nr:PAS domain-containing protein [Puniceicoccaceae bacterium K14]
MDDGKNGHDEWVSRTKIPLRDEKGEVEGCIGIGRGITEQKRKEQLIEKYAEELG